MKARAWFGPRARMGHRGAEKPAALVKFPSSPNQQKTSKKLRCDEPTKLKRAVSYDCLDFSAGAAHGTRNAASGVQHSADFRPVNLTADASGGCHLPD